MNNLIGQSLGRYHILEQLGEGGMATVYKAYDTQSEQDVAIKIIRRGAFPPEQLERILKRFDREARSLAKLTHPNIIQVRDFGEFDGSPFLVLDYVPSGTLKDKLGGRPIPWQEAVSLAIKIARGLQFAHDHKIIHRDVKPSNILLTPAGEPLITDFGIAKVLEGDEGATLSTTTGVGIGTPEYMSPEQGMGKEVDERADVYSLGVVMYEMVTGQKPFRADTPMAIIVKHINDPLPSPKKFTPALPSPVEKIILKAMAKKTEYRYKNMASFAAALEKALPKEVERTLKLAAYKAKPRQDSIAHNTVRVPQLARSFPWKSAGVIGAIVIAFAMIGLVFKPGTQPVAPTLTFTFISPPTITPAFKPTIAPTSTPTATPSLTPTPVYMEGKLLFSKDFEDNDIGGWMFDLIGDRIENNGRQYWSIVRDGNNSVLHAEPPIQSGFSIGSESWKDYVVKFRIKHEKLGSGGITVTFRESPGKNCHKRYETFISLSIRTLATEGFGTPCLFTEVSASNKKILSLNTWYSIRIEMFGARFWVFVDDVLVDHFTDRTSTQGGVSFGSSGGTSIYFDDIQVYELIVR